MISIILPVLNAERFLRESLDSLAAQTYRHYEILAVDGGSTDETPRIVQAAPRTRFLRQAGQGLAEAWNTGLSASQGEYICFIDSDDLWANDKLARQLAHLEQHPELEFVIGRVKLFLQLGCPRPATLQSAVFQDSYIGHMPGTLMARRRLFDRLGDFESKWGVTPDIEWFARLHAERVPGAELPEVVLFRRVHEDNLSQRAGPQQIQRELLQIFKQSLDRQRRRAARADQQSHGQ